MMETPNYVKSLLTPNGHKSADRRVWSIELQGTWLPFFTATNVTGDTAIPKEVLGAPLRLVKSKDGSVKFSSNGRPVMRVAKELSAQVRLVKENFIAGLHAFTTTVMTDRTDDYKAMVEACQLAGNPIVQRDNQEAIEAIVARAESQPEPPTELEAVAA